MGGVGQGMTGTQADDRLLVQGFAAALTALPGRHRAGRLRPRGSRCRQARSTAGSLATSSVGLAGVSSHSGRLRTVARYFRLKPFWR